MEWNRVVAQLFAKGTVVLTVAMGIGATTTYGLDLDSGEIRGESSKNVVSVLQNRYFVKSYRPEIGLIGGYILDEAYTNTQSGGVRLGLFFNEWFGAEVQWQRTTYSDTADRTALNKKRYWRIEPVDEQPVRDDESAEIEDQLTVVRPDSEVNPVDGMIDINAVAAPFYGKLNVMNKLIIYTDIYVTAGMATVDTSQGSKSALTIGAGERFYIGKSWSIRIDFKDRIFTETRAGEDSARNLLSVDFGASYFFDVF